MNRCKVDNICPANVCRSSDNCMPLPTREDWMVNTSLDGKFIAKGCWDAVWSQQGFCMRNACPSGYEYSGSQECTSSTNEAQKPLLVVYTGIGGLLVGAAFTLLWHIKKHPEKARELLISMLKEEMRIALSGCLEIGDIVFDSIVFANILKADHNTVTNALRSTWVCFFVVACVISVLNLYLKFKLFIECLRHRDRQEEHETGSKLAKHNQRLHATTRHIKGILSGMMIALGESMLRFCC